MSKYKFKSLICPDEKVTEEQLETDRNLLTYQSAIDRMSRRKFMGGMSGAAALAMGAGFITPAARAQTTTAPSVVDVLNFALNLEYLEANLYTFASTGAPIASTLMGTSPGANSVYPPAALYTAVKGDGNALAIATALAFDETQHIMALRARITQLGGTPISQPTLNYAAQGTLTTVAQFFMTARSFTEVGNGAYTGAAQYLVSDTTTLTAASQILGAEGQHLGAVNYQCNVRGFATVAVDALDVPPTGAVATGAQYFSVTTSAKNYTGNTAALGLGIARTTAQDLGIVYGVSTAATTTPAAGTTSGGFFPAGVNGNIKST